MQHLDEHTIELYVLGSEIVKDQIGEIEAHFEECHGCRLLADQMKGFYLSAERELEASERFVSAPSKAIVKRQGELDFVNENFAFPVQQPIKRYLAKFLYFVYRHPVTAGVGGFVLVIALAGMLNYAFDTKKVDPNPSFYFYNSKENHLEIKDNNSITILKEFSASLEGDNFAEIDHNVRFTYIYDLDQDGKNEVITTLCLRDEVPRLGRSLKIFKNNGALWGKIYFNEQFKYSNRFYSSKFDPHALLIGEGGVDNKKEIFVGANNVLGSPFIIARLNENGNTIGKYWHFGYLPCLFSSDISGDGKKEIIACGTNDAVDSLRLEFPVIIVLNPDKIIGNVKSCQAIKYDWNYSKAELFYLRLPYTFLNNKFNFRGIVDKIEDVDDNNFSFRYNIIGGSNDNIFIYFYFTKDMKIIKIQPDDNYSVNYNKYYKSGEVKKTLNEHLEYLKNNIEYWDGEKWRKEWSVIKQ